ncbi:DUF1622 domain-containing protein [Tateyamaria pelophila]|uniref:DUF1622 domain-containing protein n=1 Tax=Tateyamaria pelophila TaxID=328415 RepID=UPI001CBE921E|nr:DUF1622 domain-containing protein [Tateyamaria pelophila]
MAIETCAVALLVIGLLVATFKCIQVYFASGPEEAYRTYRQNLGRCLILGLEILIAADIVQTVTVEMTVDSVLLLGLLVIVRTFLSFTLELELTGRWPWQGEGDGKTAK